MNEPRLGRPATIAPLWTVQEVAEFLRVPVQTLYSWRSTNSGPPARRVGKYLRYRPEDVMAWVDGLGTGVA
jgi:excisionase family DNA binding protein